MVGWKICCVFLLPSLNIFLGKHGGKACLSDTADAVVKQTACFGALGKDGRTSVDIHQWKSCLLMVLYVCVTCDVAAFPWSAQCKLKLQVIWKKPQVVTTLSCD